MRVRTRDRSKAFASYTGSHVGVKADGTEVVLAQWTGGGACHSVCDLQTITDEALPKGVRPDKSRTHHVDHLVTNGEILRRSGTFKFGNAPYVQTRFAFSDIDITDFSPPILPSSSAIAAAQDEALRFFGAGCTKEEVSIPLFVWELGEVRRLIDQITALIRLGKSTTKHFQPRKQSPRHNLPVAEEFGVAPVVRDIQNSFKAILGIADRLKWMRENDGQPVKVRFTKELPTAAVCSSAIPYYSYISWHKGFSKSHCRFRAHARIRYNVRYLGDTEIKLRILAQSLGFTNPLKVVWDHIPFSFLVDKLYDIGNLIERFSMPFVFQHHVEDMGWSIKVEEVYRWYYTWQGTAFCISETQKKFYQRRRGLALTFQAPAFTDPSVDALAYGLRFLSLAKF